MIRAFIVETQLFVTNTFFFLYEEEALVQGTAECLSILQRVMFSTQALLSTTLTWRDLTL
jgi:hypothetical protein